MLQKLKFTLMVFAILFLLIVTLQNTAPTEVQILLYQVTLPTTVLLICTTAAGFLLGALTTGRVLRRRARAASGKKASGRPASDSPAAK